ncbi:MAG: 4-alpha-glucanotransferase [Rubricoccaceae bacterium]|nr:4-alpha-glucanotransferase [Rubricoccaceae bacterium]
MRTCGLLLHVTSLPGRFGIGDLGPAAYRFVDFLAQAKQGLWQVLPLVPVGDGHSPYSSPSTFAGNPLFVSPERLMEDGLLRADDLADAPTFPADRVDFARAVPFREGLLRRAFARFQDGAAPALRDAFDDFCRTQAGWLEDYALFAALKSHHEGRPWTDWAPPLARRDPAALDAARREHADAVAGHRFAQFLFARQWEALRRYAHAHRVRLLGDLPIYVAHDSADVWAHPDRFLLDDDGQPVAVAGVPPDYFSETGQRWGNPLYRWDRMHEAGYRWWIDRLTRTLSLVDLVRLDHFRGFEAYWSVPAEEATAIHGTWVEGPGAPLFEALERVLGRPLPLVAEDLGTITPGVVTLMEHFGLPGMAVLQFAFGGDADNGFRPHNFRRGAVAYTGTHDNDTFRGWWEGGATPEERAIGRAYLGPGEPHWAAIRAVATSVADTVVFPLQDVLGLGSEARMNTPGQDGGNWAWRVADGALTADHAERLALLTQVTGRVPG